MLGTLALAALLLTASPAARTPARQDTCGPQARTSWSWNQPAFTPYTRAPELTNRSEMRSTIEALYPPELKERGVSGSTYVWAHIDRCGAVVDARVRSSSGHEAFDSAALRVTRLMHFLPALQGLRRVDVWVQLPILFGDAPHPTIRPTPPGMPPTVGALEEAPPSVGRTDLLPRLAAPEGYVGPSLLNAGELLSRMNAGYAALGGQGGDSVHVALHIDVQGRVTDARVAISSGSARLDSLALALARTARFTPAVDPNRRYCSLWTMLPLRFTRPAQH